MKITLNYSGIYAIIHTASDKRYVGSAVNIHNRFYYHRRLLGKGKHKNAHLQNAWNKYGAGCFKFVVIRRCPVEQLINLEQYYIDEQPEYNIAPTAGNSLGVKRTPEFKAKISAAVKGRKHSLESRAKMSAVRMGSNGLKGRPCSSETRAKIAAAQSGEKHRLFGKHHSAETIAKIRKYRHTPEAKAKISASWAKRKAARNE